MSDPSQQNLFESMVYTSPVPKTKEDWQHLAYQADSTFSPHAPIDDETLFAAAAVADAYSFIRRKKASMPDIARQVTAFCEADRGPTLARTGAPKSYEYRFIDPLVRPYTIIRGISDKMIKSPPSTELSRL